jgi:Protein of unknown function (DUF763)
LDGDSNGKKRSGSAVLPLHGGRVPQWLATRMSSLGAIITQAIVHHYGRDELLQSFAYFTDRFNAVYNPDYDGELNVIISVWSGRRGQQHGSFPRRLRPRSQPAGVFSPLPDSLRPLQVVPASRQRAPTGRASSDPLSGTTSPLNFNRCGTYWLP